MRTTRQKQHNVNRCSTFLWHAYSLYLRIKVNCSLYGLKHHEIPLSKHKVTMNKRLEKMADQKSGWFMEPTAGLKMWKTRLFWTLEKRREDCRPLNLSGGIQKKSKSKASSSQAYSEYAQNCWFSPMFAPSFVLCWTRQRQSSNKIFPVRRATSQWAEFQIFQAGVAWNIGEAEEGSKALTSVGFWMDKRILSLRNMNGYILHKLRPLSSSPSTGRYLSGTLTSLRRLLCLLHFVRDTTPEKHSASFSMKAAGRERPGFHNGTKLPREPKAAAAAAATTGFPPDPHFESASAGPRGADACRLHVRGLITESCERAHGPGISGDESSLANMK